MDRHYVCEFCAVRDNTAILGAGSGCKTYVDTDGSLYTMCKVCADQEKVVKSCKACDIGCLFDNADTHGFCEQCYETSINGNEYHDLMVARLGEVKKEYDALAREVNAALGLPADDGTFDTFDSCEEDKISIFADKLCSVDLEPHPELYKRTFQFYRDVDRYAIERCNKSDSSETDEPEEAEQNSPAAKKQRTI
jgi:hypothetical protein